GVLAGLAITLTAALTPVRAQDYPTRPIRLVVAFPAGGPTDFVARLLADKLKGILGQSVLIENKSGANAAIGADYVAKSDPDGYTLFFTTISAVVMNPHLRADLPYDPVRDFAPVTRVVLTTEVLVVSTKSPIKSAKELIDLAKEKNGGLPMASTGVGSLPHLALELFQQSAGIKVVHVPYRGAAPAVTDILGGQVIGSFLDLPVVMPQIIGGNLRALGTASAKRDEVLPDLPTFDEQGYRDVYADNWYAVFAPARTPAPVIARLNSAFRAALTDPEIGRKLLAAGAVPAPTSPEELGDILKADLDRWGKIIRARNIKTSE
ncbi:MAG TPA: tripartite tricarboxylate transporter substrate binding protein, partial [Bradyrhizobium sp.]|nr:tripartite tricarboxylate transporter substrate binding protein [Bradyrhizobium sp.]